MATAPTQTVKLKNKRLSEANRSDLFALAKRRVEATEDTTAFDAAYTKAADAIRALVEDKFPPKDMKVLAKYNAAGPGRCIRLAGDGYRYTEFCFRDEKEAPVRPGRGGCSNNPFLLEGSARDAFDDFELAEKAHKKAVKERLDTFKALIWGVQSFNEVASIWPDAEELREAIVGSGSALIVLSEDVVAKIKADPAFKMAA